MQVEIWCVNKIQQKHVTKSQEVVPSVLHMSYDLLLKTTTPLSPTELGFPCCGFLVSLVIEFQAQSIGRLGANFLEFERRATGQASCKSRQLPGVK